MKLLNSILAGVTALAAVASADPASAREVSREHRSIWMTPYLSSNWPSSAITAANAAQHKAIIERRMASFKQQNINVVYFHVRAMCDANYRSSYEPWSSTVSGKRGVEPALDPLATILEAAHANGIEVYAWLNPYRYSGTANTYGAGDLNYENSHPDWLLRANNQVYLNPGLPEVEQRIVDVISEIVTNYDVDGVIFDDYFYPQGGTPNSADADLYKKYTDAGGKLKQDQWRRDNVNRMVARVHSAVKAIKPYVAFGIGPAGVASPPNVQSEYGLTPAPGGGDWQYGTIYSDPLAWLKAGTIDFISPQIYWPDKFNGLADWWAGAVAKYRRHSFPSVDISDISTYRTTEFIREANYMREANRTDESGIVFFQYAQFVNYTEKVFDKRQNFGDNMRDGAFTSKALTPLRYWEKASDPCMTANVRLDGSTLRWDEVPGMRYTVYTVPETMTDGEFSCQRELLDGVSYTNSYTLPDDKLTGYRYAVAVYDRYGNEYSPLFAGAVASQGTPASLVYPAEGETAVDLFDFSWTGTASRYVVEVAADAAFNDVVGVAETPATSLSSASFPTLIDGNTYFWRVRSTGANTFESVSPARSFVAGRVSLTYPDHGATGVTDSPVITWAAAAPGSTYTLEIALNETFANIVHTADASEARHEVPQCVLNTGRTYYARVTATRGDARSVSATVRFSTVDRDDYPAPVFAIPVSAGATVHADQCITVQPWSGMNSVSVNISASNTFPSRSSYTTTLSNFATQTPLLSSVKISGKNLVDGNTYYVRARGVYSLTSNTTNNYTDYTEAVPFVYSSAAGVNDVTADASTAVAIDATGTVSGLRSADVVTVYNLAGTAVARRTATGATLSLSSLPRGAYIVKVDGHVRASLKWIF